MSTLESARMIPLDLYRLAEGNATVRLAVQLHDAQLLRDANTIHHIVIMRRGDDSNLHDVDFAIGWATNWAHGHESSDDFTLHLTEAGSAHLRSLS